MRDENCIFCKIAAGEIPSATLYEDDDFRVILDIEPASKGHALILPKEHYANLYELDDEIASTSTFAAISSSRSEEHTSVKFHMNFETHLQLYIVPFSS